MDIGSIQRIAVRGVNGVADLGREALGEVTDVARTGANVVRHVPEAIPTWLRVAEAVRSGERTVLPGKMPAYPKLDPMATRAAVARGAGRTVPQSFLASDPKGPPKHEPVTLVVQGSRADLVRALRARGWVEADPRSVASYVKQGLSVLTRWGRFAEGPMSPMYLDGKAPAFVLSKNSDYNLARDHMRVFPAGKDPVTGQARWAIAATRDTAATVTIPKPTRTGPMPWDWKVETPRFGHATDHDLDGERDLIMHDLLASGRVGTWAAVPGARQGAKEGRAADGRLDVNQYRTDGRVYEVVLRQY